MQLIFTTEMAIALAGPAIHFAADHIDEFHSWIVDNDPDLAAAVSQLVVMKHLAEAHEILAPSCDTPII